jgi:hypothetical protein
MRILVIAAAALGIFSAEAMAQEGTASGIAGGAATGAVLGGPVGAAVGAGAGAVIGTMIDPPPAEVRTYVTANRVEPVQLSGTVVVGEPIPETVVLHPVPQYETYSYAYVNGAPVIVDANTRTVVYMD